MQLIMCPKILHFTVFTAALRSDPYLQSLLALVVRTDICAGRSVELSEKAPAFARKSKVPCSDPVQANQAFHLPSLWVEELVLRLSRKDKSVGIEQIRIQTGFAVSLEVKYVAHSAKELSNAVLDPFLFGTVAILSYSCLGSTSRKHLSVLRFRYLCQICVNSY